MKFLSEVSGEKIDEVFIGSCMTNIGHFRAAGQVLQGKKDMPTRLWVAPPTKMDQMILTEEGYYGILGATGARMETSTRNFPNRLGIDTRVYLASAELSAVAALLGRLPTPQEYFEQVESLNAKAGEVYKYMNFDKIKSFSDVADTVTI